MKNKIAALLLLTLMMFTDFKTGAAESGRNIAKGRAYAVEFGAPTEYSYRNYTENGEKFDIDTGCLTDGVYAAANVKDARYYRAFRSVSRFICFDFGEEAAISGYGGSFLHAGGGVYEPAYLRLWLSADGEHYVCVHEYRTGGYSGETVKRVYELKTEKTYRARYVKVEFECGVFVWCDEITVTGGDADAASELPEYAEQKDEGYFPQGSADMNGIASIIKIYDGYYSDQARADNTAEELLPYIAYMQKGEVRDTMFDTVAFVPCHTDYPSGGRLTKSGNSPGAVMSDWELYISRTFHAEFNLAALEKAAAVRNAALGIDTKVKVLLTVPYPLVQEKPFGDIDGDGKNEYSRTASERAEIIKWYVRKVCDMFDEAGYKNIELAGFYWYREEIAGYDSADEFEFITSALGAIHEIRPSACVLYDPFYLSVGFDKWREYGFDGAVMQPNLVFRTSYYRTEMLGEFAQTIYKYGLGVEIETAEPHNFRSAENIKKNGEIYENYLYYGAKTGYMNALQTFYQGAGPGAIYNFYVSDDPYMNYLYTLTYRYIKRSADMGAPNVTAEDARVPKDKKRYAVDLDISGDLYTADFTAEASALHGKCQMLVSNRRVFYTPESGYTGEDVITVKFTTKFGDTAICEINGCFGRINRNGAFKYIELTAP
ncbi:MAG: DUF4855 domain-containing protein, partial [Clostridia bacterium]|nr:DUF4855 domain-containing protein [Clostridia bacterium]